MGDSVDAAGLPVRKISVESCIIQISPSDSENKPNNFSHSSKVICELKNEPNITRNDSYSKFGHLETVSLDIPEQIDPSPSTLIMNPVTGNIPYDTSQQRMEVPGQVIDAAPISLNQYFGSSANNSQQFSTNETAHLFHASGNSSSNQIPVNEALKSSEINKTESEYSSMPLKTTTNNVCGSDTVVEDFSNRLITNPVQMSPAPSVAFNQTPALISPIVQQADSVSKMILESEDIVEEWLSSKNTQQILAMVTSSEPGTFVPERHYLTTPNVIIEKELEDPIKLLLHEISPTLAQGRKVLTADDVPQSEAGVKKLINNSCYHAAINLTGRLLKNLKKSSSNDSFVKHSPFSLKLWFIRIALFVKLRKFSFAEVESQAFGDFDKPDLYYEFYPDIYPGKKGSLVPFSFRLLLTELPQYQGNHQIALNNLYGLNRVIQKMIENLKAGCAEDGSDSTLTNAELKAKLELWQRRECTVLYSILNCFFSQKDYFMLVSIIRILIEKDKEHTCDLYSALGRIYLQLGDMKQARNCFNLAAIEAGKFQDKNYEIEKLINKALLSITHNENEEAYKIYEQALEIQPDNPMLVNNMAVCLLYMGCLKESLTLLEKTIQKNPAACLHDGILFNICTLYELESSHCTMKKQAMLNLVSKYAGDSFMVSSLKIPSNVRA